MPALFRHRAPLTTDQDDALLDGGQRSDDLELHETLENLRGLAETPTAPSVALAEVLAGERAVVATPAPAGRGRSPLRVAAAKVAGLSVAAQVGLGVVAASALTVGAASTDVLPAPAQDAVAGWVERVTPFDLPDSADRGQRIAEDARDETPGVDGPSVSEDRGRPEPPGRPNRQTRQPGRQPAPPAQDRGATPPAFEHLPPYQLWRPAQPAPQPSPATPTPSDRSARPAPQR